MLLAASAMAAPTHITAELVAEPGVAGGESRLALRMRPEAGWHGYWRNPGDAGYGMQLEWTLPGGVKTGEPRYPVPQTLLVSGLMNHVFESEYAVLVPVTLPAGLAKGTTLPVRVKANWLACTGSPCGRLA